MPLYDYRCARCGDFREWRGMSQSGEPVPCPTCGEVSARSVQAPSMNLMAANRRIAHERNEKSAHEPRVMSRQQLDRLAPTHAHPHEGGQGHGHGPSAAGKPHVHRSQRPWMIGH